MKVKVLQPFQDKHTQQVYKVDEVIEVSKERLTEIENVSKELVEVVKSTKKKSVKDE